jgi:hypothetical protein
MPCQTSFAEPEYRNKKRLARREVSLAEMAHVGHLFQVIKREFGYTNIRYRGLAKMRFKSTCWRGWRIFTCCEDD